MIAPNHLPVEFAAWNARWGAPYGYEYSPFAHFLRLRPLLDRVKYTKLLGTLPGLIQLQGPFAYQSNSTTRTYEYPWAYYASPIQPGMKAIDIGGGMGGFQFVLDKSGLQVTNVDPGDPAHEWVYTKNQLERLNRAFGTRVELIPKYIQEAGLEAGSYDRAFCISVIEHLPAAARLDVMKSVYGVLRKGGLFVLTVDLFLDIEPFSQKKSNKFGTNASIHELISATKFKLHTGNRHELYGFKEFNIREIFAKLDTYLIGQTYPVLSQLLVLEK